MKLEKDPGATTLVTLFKPRNLEELVRDYNLNWRKCPSLSKRTSPTKGNGRSITLLLGVAGAGLLAGMRLFVSLAALAPVCGRRGCHISRWLGSGIARRGAASGLLVRRGAPLSFRVLGGTLGAAAGLIGITAVQFECLDQQAPHRLVWHAGALH